MKQQIFLSPRVASSGISFSEIFSSRDAALMRAPLQSIVVCAERATRAYTRFGASRPQRSSLLIYGIGPGLNAPQSVGIFVSAVIGAVQ